MGKSHLDNAIKLIDGLLTQEIDACFPLIKSYFFSSNAYSREGVEFFCSLLSFIEDNKFDIRKKISKSSIHKIIKFIEVEKLLSNLDSKEKEKAIRSFLFSLRDY